MKKKFSWLILAIGALAFVACSDDNSGGGGGGGSTDNVLKDYFSIENASFVSGTLPSGTEDLISDFSIGNYAMNGGSSIVTITSPEKLKTAYIGIKGVSGYYKHDLTNALRAATGGYEYDVILLMSQTIIVDNFIITITVETINGNVSAPANSDKIEVIEVATAGKLQVSLEWDQLDDVDLHLFEPDGNEVCYWNMISTDGGGIDEGRLYFDFLCAMVTKYTIHNASNLNYDNEADWEKLEGYLVDLESSYDFYLNYEKELETFFAGQGFKIYGELNVDSNPSCNIDGFNKENVTYKDNVKKGRYVVAVDLFEKCYYSNAGAKYSVTVNYNGNFVTISNKQFGQFPDDFGGSYDNYDEFVVIGAFTIDNNGNIKADSNTSFRSSQASFPVKESRFKSFQKQMSKKAK